MFPPERRRKFGPLLGAANSNRSGNPGGHRVFRWPLPNRGTCFPPVGPFEARKEISGSGAFFKGKFWRGDGGICAKICSPKLFARGGGKNPALQDPLGGGRNMGACGEGGRTPLVGKNAPFRPPLVGGGVLRRAFLRIRREGGNLNVGFFWGRKFYKGGSSRKKPRSHCEFIKNNPRGGGGKKNLCGRFFLGDLSC